MIAVGTSTRSVGIYIDSISDTLQHTYGVNAPVKSLCWVLNDTLAIEMET